MSIGSWFKNILFGKNGSKSKSQKKNKKNNRGAAASTDRARQVAKDTATSNNPVASKSEKQQARNRLRQAGSGGNAYRAPSLQSKPQKQQPKPKPRVPEKSSFEKFVEANKNKISSPRSFQAIGTIKGSTAAVNAYRARMKAEEEKKKANQAAEKEKKAKEAAKQQVETMRASTARFGGYNKSKTYLSDAAEARKGKVEKQAEKERQERHKELTGAYEKEYDKYAKGPVSNEVLKGIEKAKKGIDKEIAKSASDELKKKQKMLSLGGKIELKKEIEEKAPKKKKSKQMTTDEAMKSMAMVRNRANNAKADPEKYDKKYYSDDLRKKVANNIQAGYDNTPIGMGFMSGSMPVADLKKAVEKTYGIKLDDSRAKQKLSYKVAEAAGYLAKSGAFGSMGEEAIAKALTKAVAKKVGKQTLKKGTKFAINRASEAAASLPINIEDAAKNSKDVKEFGKNMAVNTALDAGLGTVLDGGVAVAKSVNKKNTQAALSKIKTGEALTKMEQRSLQSTVARVVAKSAKNQELDEVEKVVSHAIKSGDVQKVLKAEPKVKAGKEGLSTVGNSKEAPHTANANAIASTPDNAYVDAPKEKTPSNQAKLNKKDSLDINAGDTLTVGQDPTSLSSNSNPSIGNSMPVSAQKSNIGEGKSTSTTVDNGREELIAKQGEEKQGSGTGTPKIQKTDSDVMVDLESDPAVRDIIAGPKNKEKSNNGSIKQELIKLKDQIRQKTVDSLQGLEVAAKRVGGDVGDRLYHQTNALRQAGEKANYSIMNKQTDFNMQEIGKGGMEILRPIMKQGKDTYADFNAYLFHNLNIDRFKNNKSLWGKDAITPEKSKQIISQFDDKYPGFRQQADEVVQYFKNLNDVRVGSGLISREQKDLLEELYQNYVPAFRKMNKKELERSAGEIKVNTGIFSAKGGDQAILPIHEQMAYVTQQAWKSAELNQTIKTLAEAQGLEIKDIADDVLKNGVTEESLEKMLNHSTFFKEDGGRIKATYFVDGKPYHTEVDKVIYDGLKQWTPQERNQFLDSSIVKGIDKGLTKWNNLHKSLITTYNFFFTMRNICKDMGDALWYAESSTNFIAHIPAAMKHMSSKDKYWQLWKAAGGKYSGLLNVTKELNPSKYKNANPLKWINAVNDAVEQYPRFVEFCSVLDKELKGADPVTATKEMIDKAAHAGADITCNFGRVGSLVKPLNRTAVPFLNASIQGADKLWRVISGQKGARGYINLLTKLTAIGVAPGVAMEMMYANDEGFQDLNARDKDNYIFIKDDAGAFWAIPRARGASTVTVPAQMFARKLLGNGDMSFDEFSQKLINDIGVVNPRDANIFSQLWNTYNNQTWYGGSIETYADGEVPKIERYNSKTSSIGKKASEAMYNLIKKYSDEETAEKYTLSPKKIDYLIDSYTGIVGDVALSKSAIGSTKIWYHQLFDKNMKKDPVYSNHLSQDYYDKSDELNKYCNDDGSPKKGATIEQAARGQIFKNNNIVLSNLRDLQNSVRMNKDMSRSEKAKYDRELQTQINNIYRNGVSEKAIKAYDDFIKEHKDQYMSSEKLIKAAQQAYEKETHASVTAMDTIYKIGGLDEVVKNSSSYIDKSGDKNRLVFSKEKTIKQILKKYRKNGGNDDDFYSVYREMTQANKERGIGTNSAYGNLAAITIGLSGKGSKVKATLRDAFGVSEESRQIVNEYFKQGGSKKEYLAAAEVAEATAASLRQKNGDKYNYFAPFKARGLAEKKLPDRAYRIIDSADSSRRAEYYINNSRGLKHYNISAKTLQELDNKCAKNEKGYTTSEGLQKVLDKSKYNREEKALIWEALYGYSYKEANPYGSIRDYSLKSDVGIDTSGGYRHYGYGGRGYRHGYRRYGRRGYGHSGRSGGSAEEKTEFEKYVESLLRKQQARKIVAASMNYSKLNTKKYTSDQYRKAIAKLVAKKLMDK